MGFVVGLLCAGAASAQNGGNRVLMDEWVKKKSAVQSKVVEELRSQGKLPKDGEVMFEARVKPDPADPSRLRMKIDKLFVSPSPVDPARPQSEWKAPLELDSVAPIDVTELFDSGVLVRPYDGGLGSSFRMRAGEPVELVEDAYGIMHKASPPVEQGNIPMPGGKKHR